MNQSNLNFKNFTKVFIWILISYVRSECGIIKLINSEESIFPSKSISGAFSTPFGNQYSFYTWIKLVNLMEAKDYVMFRMSISDTAFGSSSQNSLNDSIYSEIFKISWNAATDILTFQYPGGNLLSQAKQQPFENVFNSSGNWRFIAFSFDFDKSEGKFFLKSYDDLNEILLDLPVSNVSNITPKDYYRIVLGGDGITTAKDFNGVFSNAGFLTAYYQYLNYIYLIDQSTRAINDKGVIIGSGLSPNSSNNLHTYGLSKDSVQIISDQLLEKFNSNNLEEVNFSTGESVVFQNVQVSTDRGSVINSLYMNLDFSFSGEFPVDFHILDVGNYGEPNSVRISLVEENSELAVKGYSDERVVLLDVNTQLPPYVYNSSLKNPRVLKISIITSKNQTFTFLSKDQLKENERHKIVFGVIYHFPEVIRIYYGTEQKNISLTSEIFGLPFQLDNKNVSLFFNNNNVTGGKFKMNSFTISDSFFDFFLTNTYDSDYMTHCYSRTSSYLYNLAGSSRSILNSPSKLSISVTPNSNETFSIFCDESKGYFMIEGVCSNICLPGFYFNEDLQECKRCISTNCSNEISGYSFEVSEKADKNPSDKFISLQASSNNKIYKIPVSNSSSNENLYTSENYLNKSNIPLTVLSDSLELNKDFKYKVIESEVKDGVFNSEIEIELLNPPKSNITNFQIIPNFDSSSSDYFYATSDKNPLKIESKAIDINTTNIKNCSSSEKFGKIIGYIYLVFYFILVLFFLISNFLVLNNYIKWKLFIGTVGSHLIAFCFLAKSEIGQLSFSFAEVIFNVLLKYFIS